MKKRTNLVIIALIIAITVVFVYPAVSKKAKADALISTHQATKIYQDLNIPYNGANKKSDYENITPKITVLTHGYGGNPANFSNTGGGFAPNDASIINKIISQTEVNGGVNIYYAEYEYHEITEITTRTFYKLSYNKYNYNPTDKIEMIDDVSKHIILIYEASKPVEGHKVVYDEFHELLDDVSLQYKALTGFLPIYNLIGHSRGGVINLMYATEHPYNVDKVISMGTPYRGSRLGSIDQILVFAGMLENTDVSKPQGMKDILSETDPSDPQEAALTTSATEVRDAWNAVYSQGIRANVIAIGSMVDLSFVSKILTDPTVSGFISADISKVLQKVIQFADTVPGLVEFAVNFVSGLASVLNFFGVNTISDLIGVENSWTEVDINIYRNILQLVKNVNGNLLIADDLFIDTDSQLGYGFVDGVTYSGFSRYIKVMSASDVTSNRSVNNVPVGHNLETMNADIVNFIGNSLLYGYSSNNVEPIEDDEELQIPYSYDSNVSFDETDDWINYKLYKYQPDYDGNRKISLTNAQVQIYKYNESGLIEKDSFANLLNYYMERGKTYYLKVKPLNTNAEIIITPSNVITASTTIQYSGSAAFTLKAQSSGFYAIQIPKNITVSSNGKTLLKHAFPSDNYMYVAYFNAQEKVSVYLRGGSSGTIPISFTRVDDISGVLVESEKLASSDSQIRAYTITNNTNTDKTYTVFAYYNATTPASSFSAYNQYGALTLTNTSAVNYNVYRFTIQPMQTICAVFGQGGTEFKVSLSDAIYEWIVDGELISGDNAFIPQTVVSVQLREIINSEVSNANCPITVSNNLLTGDRLNLRDCSVGDEVYLYYTSNAEVSLKIYIMPLYINFVIENNDAGVRIRPVFSDKNNLSVDINFEVNMLCDNKPITINSRIRNYYDVPEASSASVQNIVISGGSYVIRFSDGNQSTSQSFIYRTVINTHFYNGDGRDGDPYGIACARHLRNIRYAYQNDFKLLNDINLGTSIWTPIPEIHGCFDGNNFSISNLNIRTNDNIEYYGFISNNYGTIKNVTFTNVSIQIAGSDYVYCGTVCGRNNENSEIINCTVNTSKAISISSTYFILGGGLVGLNRGIIERCKAIIGTFSTTANSSRIGGLIGWNSGGEVTRSLSKGNIESRASENSSNINVGGLIGYCEKLNKYNEEKLSNIKNCYSKCNVWAEATGASSSVLVGGLIGYLFQSKVQFCYATGNVTGRNKTGSVKAGGFAASIYNCTGDGYVVDVFTFGDVYARGNYSGAERDYSFFGRFCGSESNNSFLNIYYFEDSRLKDGLHGTNIQWDTDWYTGKSEEELKSIAFQQMQLYLDSSVWIFTEGQFPELR